MFYFEVKKSRIYAGFGVSQTPRKMWYEKRNIIVLQIKQIYKQYKTGDLIQKALDGVSLNFRDSEFVAILGPSRSGKTTFLKYLMQRHLS